MRSMVFVLFSLSACSGDSFSGIPEGGLPEGDADAESSTVGDSGTDPDSASGLDASDSGVESSTPDAKCEQGTPACHATWDAYCLRLKTCCSGTCVDSWANSGGAACVDHFLANAATYCANRASDTRCDETCLGDIQGATCSLVTGQASIYGISKISSACMAYWQ